MMENDNIYNNEAFGAMTIYSVLTHLKNISLSKSLLIIPFFSHKGTINFLKKDNTILNSIEEFIIKKPECFLNFNDRYYSFIALSINSILLLIEMKVVFLKENKIVLDEKNIFEINENEFGVRAMNIKKSAFKLSKILIEEDKNLYLKLRVQL